MALMMIPQGMTCALVAGLPPVAGLYASIAPPLLYALLGTSPTQSVGPMMIVSLSAVNAIDTSALLGLLELNEALKVRGIGLNLAEVKGPVLDRLTTSTLLAELNGRLFLSTAMAWETLASHGNDLQA